ncbi:MAG: RimK/LysX family protein [Candidatus Woesearchaeota archaeon]
MRQVESNKILGLIEEITIKDANGDARKILAKIDTGADNSSIDLTLASELSLGPITKTKSIVSSHGRSIRPVVHLSIDIGGNQIEADFTLYNRSHMNYKVLIGKNILKQGFLIDPSKETAKKSGEKTC